MPVACCLLPVRCFGASVLLAVAVRRRRSGIAPTLPTFRARRAAARRPGAPAAPRAPSSAPYGALSQRRICYTHFGLRTMRYALRRNASYLLAHSALHLQDARGTASRLQDASQKASLSPRGTGSSCLAPSFALRAAPFAGLRYSVPWHFMPFASLKMTKLIKKYIV